MVAIFHFHQDAASSGDSYPQYRASIDVTADAGAKLELKHLPVPGMAANVLYRDQSSLGWDVTNFGDQLELRLADALMKVRELN